MGSGSYCDTCGKKIGTIASIQLRTAMRIIRKAEQKFKIDLNSKTYAGKCKSCLIVAVDWRIKNLSVDLQIEAEKSGKTVDDMVNEIKRYIESELQGELQKGMRV